MASPLEFWNDSKIQELPSSSPQATKFLSLPPFTLLPHPSRTPTLVATLPNYPSLVAPSPASVTPHPDPSCPKTTTRHDAQPTHPTPSQHRTATSPIFQPLPRPHAFPSPRPTLTPRTERRTTHGPVPLQPPVDQPPLTLTDDRDRPSLRNRGRRQRLLPLFFRKPVRLQ